MIVQNPVPIFQNSKQFSITDWKHILETFPKQTNPSGFFSSSYWARIQSSGRSKTFSTCILWREWAQTNSRMQYSWKASQFKRDQTQRSKKPLPPVMFTGVLSLKSDALIFEHQCAAVPLTMIFMLCYFMFTTLDPLNVFILWVFIQGELTLRSFDVSAQVDPAVTGLALRLLLSQMLSSCRPFFHVELVPVHVHRECVTR